MDKKFIDGVRVYKPKENAPKWIVASGIFDRDALIAWLTSQETNQIRWDLKESQKGMYYTEVNDWKPSDARPQVVIDAATKTYDSINTGKVDYPTDDIDPAEIPF